MTSEVPSKGLEWTNLILGVCLAGAAFKFAELPLAAWNAGIIGSLIVCCSAVALYSLRRLGRMVQSHIGGLGSGRSIPARLPVGAGTDVGACCDRALRCHHRRHAAFGKSQVRECALQR